MALVDGRERVTWCNPAAMRLLGCQRGRPLGLAFERLADATRQALQAAMAAPAAHWQHVGRLVDGRGLRLNLAPGPTGTRMLVART